MSGSRLATRPTIEHFVGDSDWSHQVRADILRVAKFDCTALVAGPTGTGKELIAGALHAHSSRSNRPYIPVNCAAISPSLFASHMFGHEKGAFTGADYAAKGCFRAADGGAIFLDEIGELDLDLQARLLRVLQERVVVPVGAYEGVPVNVRLIAATNRNLRREVEAGRFREDLFYRLNVVTFRTLPLCERRDDVLPIAEHCLDRLSGEHGLPRISLTDDAAQWLLGYDWPGNVRELQNVLERAVIFADDQHIDAYQLQQAVEESLDLEVDSFDDDEDDGGDAYGWTPQSSPSQPSVDAPSPASLPRHRFAEQFQEWPQLHDLERCHIEQTLQRTFYNQTAAAELLGVTFRTLSRKIKKYDIDTSRSRRGRPRRNRARG